MNVKRAIGVREVAGVSRLASSSVYFLSLASRGGGGVGYVDRGV